VTWSPDGRSLVYESIANDKTDADLWIVEPDHPEGNRALIQTPADEREAQFSPDGRWLAYTSDESGEPEVYVVAVPLTARKWQVSTTGGSHPRWRGDASEIFFISAARQVMAASLRAGTDLEISVPEMLFDSKPAGFCDVSPDGQRFLVSEPVENFLDSSLTVIVGWQVPILRR
jgi:Tol biopolymer transport system component